MTLLVGGGVGVSRRVLGFSPCALPLSLSFTVRKTGRRVRLDTPTPPFIYQV
jgi:hypothetical protein